MQLQFLAPFDFFFKAVERLQFCDPNGIITIFLIYTVLRAWSVTSTLCHKEGNFQPLWKVKGLEQYTSWKVRVPECVLLRNMNTNLFIYTYTNIYKYMYISCAYTCACTCVFVFCCVVPCQVVCRAWLGG